MSEQRCHPDDKQNVLFRGVAHTSHAPHLYTHLNIVEVTYCHHCNNSPYLACLACVHWCMYVDMATIMTILCALPV